MINYQYFVENSRKWLSKYIQDNHLQSLVIGVSGGIDSTVSCAIASPVCKELNISLIGRSLPTSTNELQESNVAQLVGEAFCTNFKTVTIDYDCELIIHNIEVAEGQMTPLQKGNIKARYRMMYLRNLASKHRGVVLDNDNFTEWMTGFWTVGGDSPMDINLGLHYLWKTSIYELADYLLEELFEDKDVDSSMKKYQALLKSVQLTPTDGNGVVTGGDCAQFGLNNYKQVDDVLKTMYYTDYSVYPELKDEEYTRLIDSYNEQGVDKVMMLHQNTEFKRQPAPIMPEWSELFKLYKK